MRKSGALLRRALMLAGACVPLAGSALAAEDPQGHAAAGAGGDAQRFEALISDKCSKCHNTTDWAGGLALDTLDVAHPGQDAEEWE
jgi:hypothetical protein